MWTLETAIPFLRELEPFLAFHGFHCALGGSVMYRGNSEKDLDVIVYPHNKEDHKPILDLWKLIKARLFADRWGECSGSCRDGKRVYWCSFEGRRVDWFFLA